MNVPFVDLHAQYQSIKYDIDAAIEGVIKDTAFIRGKYVENFEQNYANRFDVKHCISVANGTDAIFIVLKMLGVGKGDEVITTAHSWISTSETISQTGATPVFVDVDEYYGIDADLIEEQIGPKTKAIIPVHLYGQPVNMNKIMDLAKKYSLYVIEDCAQSHFATWEGSYTGTFGDAATYSFYPSKNLGAFGDAGAILTNDKQLAEKCRRYSNHGAVSKHDHKIEGINSRMDGLQAAILDAKLNYIDEWNKNRQKIAAAYDDLLKSITEVEIPKTRDNVEHVYHLYVVKVQNRPELIDFLNEHSIQTGIHYPTPLPMLKAYEYLDLSRDNYPRAIQNSTKILSLPIYPEMDMPSIEYVCNKIKTYFRN